MRRPGPWALTGGVVSLLLALALFDPYLFTGGDNAAYYALAKALATGEGYVDLIAPDRPIETVFPPGYPVILVPFFWAFGGSMIGLKVSSLVAGCVVLWATWALARRDPSVPAWASAAVVWLVGLAPVFLVYTHWVLSDMSYTAVALVGLVAFARAGDEEDRWRGWWLVGCVIALSGFAFRTAGLALIVAPLAWALLRRRWRRAAAVVIITAIGAVPWLIWTAQRPPETGGYVQQALAAKRLDPESGLRPASQIVDRGWHNFLHYATIDLPQLFWTMETEPYTGSTLPPPLPLRTFGLAVGGALLAIGAWRAFRTRGITVWDLYVILTGGVLLVWPWTGDRFFLTIAPLVWLYMLIGLDTTSRFLTDGPRPAIVIAALIAAVLLIATVRQVPAQWRLTRAYLDGDEFAGYAPFWQDYFQAARWIGATAPDAIIAARKPTFAWYWSRGRPSVVYPFHRDPERTWQFLRMKGVTHIILEPRTSHFLAPALLPHSDEIELVYAAPHRSVHVIRLAPPR